MWLWSHIFSFFQEKQKQKSKKRNIKLRKIFKSKHIIIGSYLGMGTAKYYPSYSDSQISEMKIYEVVKSLARISKIK